MINAKSVATFTCCQGCLVGFGFMFFVFVLFLNPWFGLYHQNKPTTKTRTYQKYQSKSAIRDTDRDIC